MNKDKILRSVISVALSFVTFVPTISPVFALEAEDSTSLDAEDDYNEYDHGYVTAAGENKYFSGHSTETNGTVGGLDATTDHEGTVSTGTDETVHAEASEKSAETLYQVAESYTWTIHSLVDFGDSLGLDATSTVVKEDAVKVTECIMPADSRLVIQVKNLSDEDKFTVHNMHDASYTLDYDVGIVGFNSPEIGNVDEASLLTAAPPSIDNPHWVSPGDVVAVVNPGQNTFSTSLMFSLHTESSANAYSEVAGDYIGTITYLASIARPAEPE